MNDLIIAQITDIHIDLPQKSLSNRKSRTNFILTLEEIRNQKKIDLIVLSGDLAFKEGNLEIYIWIKTKLDLLNIPYLIVSGNHDNNEQLAAVFKLGEQLKDNYLYFSKTINDRKMIFLDSSTNSVSEKQLTWLKNECKHSHQKEMILFMHHPPIYCNCKYMDRNFPLQNMKEVQKALLTCPTIKNIFTGHYHTGKTLKFHNKTIHITPSTYFQINEKTKKFTIKNKKPGWRLIIWNEKGISSKIKNVKSIKTVSLNNNIFFNEK